jgi:N-acetylglucosamine-6-phosphate deacetylase
LPDATLYRETGLDALHNATIHTGDTILTRHAVLIDRDRIAAIVPIGAIPDGAVRHDLGGGILTPGFIDLQVNGGGGVLFNDRPDIDTLRVIAKAHRRFGTTGFLPTLITDGHPIMERALAAVRQALAEPVPGVLGIHWEGPHLNPDRKGVHDPAHMTAPTDADIDFLAGLGSDGCTLVTLAPERTTAARIGALTAQGVRVAAGHTAATYDRMCSALLDGVTGFTHLFNAMSPLTSREPGVVGAALDDPESWAGIIVDGHHVHDGAIRIAWKAKPRRLFLVTDAMSPVGTDRADFTLQGRRILVTEGRCVTEDGTLAGSILDMASAVRNCVHRIGIPLDEALRMASTYPAEFIGLGDRLGHIAPGFRADLVLLDEQLQVRCTWIDGSAEAA